MDISTDYSNSKYSKDERVYEYIIIDIHNSSVLDITKYDCNNSYILLFIGEYYTDRAKAKKNETNKNTVQCLWYINKWYVKDIKI